MTKDAETETNGEARPDPQPEAGEMGFFEHLEELRGILFKSVLIYALGVVLVILFINQVSLVLNFPLMQGYRFVGMPEENLITTRVFEIFNVLVVVCFLGGFVIAFPFILFFVSTFIAPGLTEKELKILGPGCVLAFFLFLLGAGFAFFLILPQAIAITAKLNQMFGIEQYLTVGSYYNTVVWVTFATGLTFEFPLVVVLLTYIDIVSVEQLRANRRLVFVIVLIVSALITPGGDPLTLSLMGGVLYGLYEMAIAVSARLIRRKL